MSTFSKSIPTTTIRFTFSDEASSLVGSGTPHLMTHLEDKLIALNGVEEVKIVRWGTPFELDVTLSEGLAAKFDLTTEDVEDIVVHHIERHVEDYKNIVKFGKVDGAYLRDQKLVVSGKDYIVLQDINTGGFAIRYETEDGDVIGVPVEDNDAIGDTIQELIDECASVLGSVARGTTHFDDWISRHKRGIIWRMK
jgi:hypothetical protein